MSAGIDNFKKFGDFNTVFNLADGDILKFDAVIQKTWNEVFVTLLYKKTKADYMDKLGRIIRERSK